MGYKRNPKIYRIAFADDSDYPGLEVQLRSLSTAQFLAADGRTASNMREMVELFADRLVSWNLEDEETSAPVPTTLEAVLAEDWTMIDDIFGEWLSAIRGVPAPLESSSPAGEISPEVSIPMEALSPSLAS